MKKNTGADCKVRRSTMKRRTLLLLLGLLAVVQAPLSAMADSGWPHKAGGTSLDFASAVAADGQGNIYVTGQFQGTANIGGVSLTSRGSSDIFIGKLDAGGMYQWIVQGGGNNADEPYGIAVDGDGNVYVTGSYASSNATFGNLVLASANSYDVFVAKLDTYGNWVWVNTATGSSTDAGLTVAVNDSREVFVGGYFRLDLSFPRPSGGNLNIDTYLDLNPTPSCSAKVLGAWDYCYLPASGGCGPCLRGGGDCDNDSECDTGLVCVQNIGAEYGTGWDLDICQRSGEPANTDAWVAKLGSGGEWQWVRSGGGRHFSTDGVTGIAVKVDASNPMQKRNLIYVSGYFQEDITLVNQPSVGAPVYFTAAAAGPVKRDVFVAKLIEDGASLFPDLGQPKRDPNPSWIWIIDGDHNGANDEMWANGIALDVDGNLFVVGGYRGAPSLTSTSLVDSGANSNAFTARLFDNGTSASWLWSRDAGSVGSYNAEAVSVAVDGRVLNERGLYVAGSFEANLTFDGSLPALTAKGAKDLFVIKYEVGDGSVSWGSRGGLYNNDYLVMSGQSKQGAITTDATGTTFVVGGFETVTSLIEGSTMALDGSSQSVYVPQNPSETDYSVSLWFKTTERSRGIYSVVNAIPPASSGHDRHLYLDGEGNIICRVWNNEVIQTMHQNYADGQWHHVVHTFGTVSGAQKLYVDGLERASGAMDHSDFNFGTQGFAIGYSRDAANYYFKGKISNVSVGGGLVPSQVRSLYQNNLPLETGGKLLFSEGNRDIFVGTLSPNGAWRESESWIVGGEVPRPTGAVAIKPDLPTNGDSFFYWSESEKKLYSTWQGGAVIKWRVSDVLTNTDRIVTVGASSWPERPQIHIAGVPVELQPSTTSYYYTGIQRTGNGASDSQTSSSGGKLLNVSAEGYTVLRYGNGGMDLVHYPVAFEVVKTVYWDNAQYLQDGAPCTIGQRITDASHNDVLGQNGFVYFTKAYYDGYGLNKAYDRDTRTGPIIAVNKIGAFNQNTHDTAQSVGKDMVVVWYETNTKNIPWPVRPVRYNCQWPTNPYKIIIASELGSDVYGQPPLDPEEYPEAHVYRQELQSQTGYNPNEEHAYTFPSATGNGWSAVFALRNDLYDVATGQPSLPYVLLKYKKPSDGKWAMMVYKVMATDTTYTSFQYQGTAGTPIFPPYPVRLLSGCAQSYGQGDPYWQDKVNKQYWAKSAGQVTARYYYPLLPTFDYPGNPSLPNQFTGTSGQCVGWLDRLPANGGRPVAVNYNIAWPADVPMLQVGETLLTAKRGLPDIVNQAATEIIYDEIDPRETDPALSLVQLTDPLSTRWTSLAALPGEIATSNVGGKLYFDDLPFHLQQRVVYDPLNHRLGYKGYFDDSGMGDPLLLLNVMSGMERDELLSLSTNASYRTAVTDLFYLSRNPYNLDLDRNGVADKKAAGQAPLIGLQDIYTTDVNGVIIAGSRETPAPDGKPEPLQALGSGFALSAGAARGIGFVTLAFNNDPSLGSLPVSLKVIRVDCGPYLGEIKVIQSLNVFDEKLTLRHSGDFGGNQENFTFEWYYHPDEGGYSPSPPPSPETSQLYGWLPFNAPNGGVGAVSIDIKGASLQTLSDNWFYVRYKGYPICNNQTRWTPWAGAPGSTALNPSAQLAEGWIKRVVRSLNAFEARVKDFHAAPTNTYASMILQAGERYEGDVAMNNDPDNLNSMGLIAAYETILRRGMTLSIDGTPPIDYAPANAALLLAASRISDFYTLLGNEAYADAVDPTIGFGTASGEYGAAAASIFAFQNQFDSLLEEELGLLRGRDYMAARPIYNRLVWNFTTGDGEIAYSQVYGIKDQNSSGVIDEYDARIQYPQGHGDAWGHYLTAMTTYYKLLRHRYYSWDPRAEAVLVAGAPVMVDYLDERKFVRTAAAKAKAGAEIVDLTYRIKYVDDPAGQWQGYMDTDTDRAWGLSEWARRAGQGAYFDWVVGNAIIPAVDTDPTHTERIQKIDRRTVQDLSEIAAQYTFVQNQLSKADSGLSPLGLAKGVVPFDIDPIGISDGQTHFEQIYDRAEQALNNAVMVFDYANQMTQQLRRNEDTLQDFTYNVSDTERDYESRLIEIYGYPYAGDIGPTGTYADGYGGPDLFHYMWIDSSELTGTAAPTIIYDESGAAYPTSVSATFKLAVSDSNAITENLPKSWNLPGQVTYNYSVAGLGIVKPANMGMRRAQGEIQRALADIYRARAAYQAALVSYDNIIEDIVSKKGDLVQLDQMNEDKLKIIKNKNNEQQLFNVFLGISKGAQIVLRRIAAFVGATFKDAAHCVPRVIGFSNDLAAPAVCGVEIAGDATQFVLETIADAVEIVEGSLDLAKEDAANAKDLELEKSGAAYELSGTFGELEALIREEPLRRLEAFQAKEDVVQAIRHYYDVLAQGERTIEELVSFRQRTAGEIQEYRYQDMTFRVFRNDAIQKYRAQFDLAARYAYLAAVAYDYETNLLGSSSAAGRRFLTGIVRERSLGTVIDGSPLAGSPGLADPLARLKINFGVLKGQLGFNNPQTETNRFSIRSELFRIESADSEWPDPFDDPLNTSYAVWTEALDAHRVADLWTVPEYRRYCRPFAPEDTGPQPGLVIPFATTVTYGLNYFGWPLGGGDSSYDATNFATKIRSAGVWFGDYDLTGLPNTPRIYLVPAGLDVLRSPTSGDMTTREWLVTDQKLPVPFPVGASDLADPGWIPLNDSLSDVLGGVRKFSSFRAYHDGGEFDPAEMVNDSRLIGRSVWNTRWMLIIPGQNLHYDPDVGLDRFISTVSDIKIFFQTYGYSGN